MTTTRYQVTIKGHRQAVENIPRSYDGSWKAAGDMLLVICVRLCCTVGCFDTDVLSSWVLDTIKTAHYNSQPNDHVYLLNYLNSNRSGLLNELCEKRHVMIITDVQ